MFLLTCDGTAIKGIWAWDGGFIAWAPLMEIPAHIKALIGKTVDWHALKRACTEASPGAE